MPLSSRVLRMARKKAQVTGTEYPLILESILKELLHGLDYKKVIRLVGELLNDYNYDFILEEMIKEAMNEPI